MKSKKKEFAQAKKKKMSQLLIKNLNLPKGTTFARIDTTFNNKVLGVETREKKVGKSGLWTLGWEICRKGEEFHLDTWTVEKWAPRLQF